MINCYILDDLPSQFKILKILINNHSELNLVGTSTDPASFIDKYNKGKLDIDLLFLDIEMPGISGIEVAHHIVPDVKIIFVTGYRDYAIEAFEIAAIDYLVKPIKPVRFEQAVAKAILAMGIEPKSTSRKNTEEMQHLVVTENGKKSWSQWARDAVYYIEACGNYTDIHCVDQVVTQYKTLKQVEHELLGTQFVRIHRKYIVNMHMAIKGAGNLIVLQNGTELPIGDQYSIRVRNYLNRK